MHFECNEAKIYLLAFIDTSHSLNMTKIHAFIKKSPHNVEFS